MFFRVKVKEINFSFRRLHDFICDNMPFSAIHGTRVQTKHIFWSRGVIGMYC